MEAVELLAKVHGTSELPASFVALMVCTCRRWDRVTARLIAAIEDSALLDDAELDELADSFLSHEHGSPIHSPGSRRNGWRSNSRVGTVAPTPSTTTRSPSTAPPSSPIAALGRPNVRCA